MSISIISAQVYTVRDEGGTPRTEGWFLLEFRAAGYMPGGEDADLRNYFRSVQHALVNPASGALDYLPKLNDADFPVVGAGVQSGRVQLWWIGSSAVVVNTSGITVNLNTSGLATDVLSGQTQALSGYTAVWSGRVLTQTSGQINAQATAWRGNTAFSEIASGTAISGTRAKAFVMGY